VENRKEKGKGKKRMRGFGRRKKEIRKEKKNKLSEFH
jgi:hypothetical protein